MGERELLGCMNCRTHQHHGNFTRAHGPCLGVASTTSIAHLHGLSSTLSVPASNFHPLPSLLLVALQRSLKGFSAVSNQSPAPLTWCFANSWSRGLPLILAQDCCQRLLLDTFTPCDLAHGPSLWLLVCDWTSQPRPSCND